MKFPIFHFQFLTSKKGFTLVDVLIGIALMLIVFLGIFGAFQLSLKVVGLSANKVTATTIANQRLEQIRNLPYESIGIEGGFPDGILEASTTVTRSKVEYQVETRIDYVVDSADGIAAPDDDCPNDYKRAEVKVSWSGMFGGQIELTTDFVAKNLAQECAEAGGILSVSVFDAYGQMVSLPLIEVKDPLTNETLKTATPAEGKHYFSLAADTYKVVVSKTDYSLEQTYGSGETYNGKIIAIPEKPHPIVLEGQLTEVSYSIDKLSSFSVDTLSPWGTDNFSDSFTDETKISDKSNVAVSGGEVNLAKTQGVYFTGGTNDGDICSFPGIDGDCAQSFTMGSQSREISQVQLYIRKTTTDTSDIYLEIRGESTIGPALGTSSVISSATIPGIPGSLSWITFTFPSPITLTANTQYFLRLRSIPDSTDPLAGAKGAIYWGYLHSTSSPPGYAGGDAWRYIGKNNNPLDPGQQLGPTDQYDFSFKIYDDEYLPSGYLISTNVSPAQLIKWDEFSFSDLKPENTDLRYQIYYLSGTEWLLIPDADLSGNSIGFDISPIDLSNLSTSTYSQLKLKGNFSTSSNGSTPVLYDWQVFWRTSQPTPIPNVPFNLEGAKIVGKEANEEPIHKYSATNTSDSNGHKDISNLEWDSYTFSVSPATGLDLVQIQPSPQPIGLSPDSAVAVSLYLDAENSLLVTVQNNITLEPIFAANVRLSNSEQGYDTTQPTNEKGQTYFIPLQPVTYNLEVQGPGYLTVSTNVVVSGDDTKIVRMEQIE